jgi:cobalt-zinc-cadmium efflux system membrane fusion protein
MKRAVAGFVAVVAVLASEGCNVAKPGEAAGVSEAPAAVAQHDPLEVKIDAALRPQLKVGPAEWAEVSGSLSVAGRVEADETRLERVGTPVTGRIAELKVVEGQTVKRGEVLATLNSTELSEGQFGYLRALSQAGLAKRATERAHQLLEAGVIGAAELQRREAEAAQAAAEVTTWRDRLRVLGMADETVARLEKTHQVNSLTQVVATMDGAILERKVTQGQVVQPADTLFLIADLTRVWLVADVPEQEAGLMRKGKALEAEVPALAGRRIRGRLTFVSATVNPETHTVRVRMDLENPGLEYKPAMLANIRLQDKPERKLVIPTTAVVREGNQDCVFVEKGADTFAMQTVTLGGEYGERRVVAGGIGPEQRIVLDGGFHLNSERKKASLHGE